MNVKLTKAEAGEYQADLINQNGQIIHPATMMFETENNLNSFNIPLTTTGIHFMRLKNKKSGKQHTEKIIIQ